MVTMIGIVACAKRADHNIVRFIASRNFIFEHAASKVVLRGEYCAVFSDNLDSPKSTIRRGIHFNSQPVTLCRTSSHNRAHRYAIYRDIQEAAVAEENFASAGNIAYSLRG